MRIKRSLAVAVAAASVPMGTAFAIPAVAASTPGPQIGRLGAVVQIDKTDPRKAYVTSEYRCFGGPGSGEHATHLWVSVKQGGEDPTAEGSSETVRSWYDTNVSHDVAVDCDGKWHSRTVLVQKHEADFSGRDLHKLRNGAAWLQYCLFDKEGRLASNSQWINVKGAPAA